MNKATKILLFGGLAIGAGYLSWRFLIKPALVKKRLQKFEQGQKEFEIMAQNLPQAQNEFMSPAIYEPIQNDIT